MQYWEKLYTHQQIQADISFLKYQIKKNCKSKLIEGTGLQRLISESEKFLKNADITLEGQQAIQVLLSLTESVKQLWLRSIPFCQQFNSLNSGDYEYGKLSEEREIFFKDLELEIFTAYAICRTGLMPVLPDHTEGNDILCEEIELQCKHPNEFRTEKITNYIKSFHKSLIDNDKYGIFVLAIEDSFDYYAKVKGYKGDYEKFLEEKRKELDGILKTAFEAELPKRSKILGIMTSASYYIQKDSSIQFNRETNSIFCFRPERKEIKDDTYKAIYKILRAFNSSPSWMTIEGENITYNE